MDAQKGLILEDLLEEARHGGALESSGSFTLDLDAAVQKMRRFHVENPYHYVNRLIRAASYCGNQPVSIVASSGKTRVWFPSPACSPGELPQLLHLLFLDGNSALRELSLAVNMALALRPSRLEIQVSDGQSASLLSLDGREQGGTYSPEVRLTAVPVTDPRTTIQLTRGRTAAMSHWGAQSPEFTEIVRRFRFCPQPITVNGAAVNDPNWWGAPRGSGFRVSSSEVVTLSRGFFSISESFLCKHHAVEVRAYHENPEANDFALGPSRASNLITVGASPPNEQLFLAVGLCADPRRQSRASFIHRGQTLQAFPLELALGGVEMLISAHGLNLDVSGEKILEDARFEMRWAVARQIFEVLHSALVQAFGSRPKAGLAGSALLDRTSAWKQFLARFLAENREKFARD